MKVDAMSLKTKQLGYVEEGGERVSHELKRPDVDEKSRKLSKCLKIIQIMQDKKYSERAICLGAGVGRNIFHDLKLGRVSHIDESELDKILSHMKRYLKDIG